MNSLIRVPAAWLGGIAWLWGQLYKLTDFLRAYVDKIRLFLPYRVETEAAHKL